MAKVISIISGKGGCGKSLLTAVLGQALAREGLRVLIVDIDIFVRGLTVLLRAFRAPKKTGGEIVIADFLGVFRSDSMTRPPSNSEQLDSLYIQRFMDCDILPAVKDVGEPLDYNVNDLGHEDFCFKRVDKLLSTVSYEYDIILLDNRAGMDSLVLASCQHSDFVITIAEDDEVGRQTNSNVVSYLRFNKKVKKVYTIINKTRHIKKHSDLSQRMTQRHDFNIVGFVPFDIDIMEYFGSERFWTNVFETLYFRTVLDAWNRIADSEGLSEITTHRYSFAPSPFMRPSLGRFSMMERMIRAYGILTFVFGGGIVLLYPIIEIPSIFRQSAPFFMLIGGLMIILSTSSFRRILLDFILSRR